MSDAPPPSTTNEIRQLLGRFAAGDGSARDALLERATRRLHALSRADGGAARRARWFDLRAKDARLTAQRYRINCRWRAGGTPALSDLFADGRNIAE